MTRSSSRTMHLATTYAGIGHDVAWWDEAAGSQMGFQDHAYLARRAEEAKLDFVFYAETLSLYETNDEVVGAFFGGRPDSLALLPGIAAVTEQIGMIATYNTTFHNPYQMARMVGSLDHLSDGRVGWNIVTSAIPSTHPNFTAGDWLPREHRFGRALEFRDAVEGLWGTEPVDLAGQHVRLAAAPPLGGPSRQGLPVVMQAGVSGESKDFAARTADIAFTYYTPGSSTFFDDVKSRLATYGREPDDLKVLPTVMVLVAPTDAEALEIAHAYHDRVANPGVVRALLERVWGYSLADYDVDGPLPDQDPDWDVARAWTSQAPALAERDPHKVVAGWRAICAAENLSMRGLVRKYFMSKIDFVGSYESVATRMQDAVESSICDGFVMNVPVQPSGFDPIFEEVVPILQERGVFRSEYEGSTLRGHLGVA